MCVCVCVCVYAQWFSHVQFFVTLWTIVFQALLSMEFSRQEYWRGLSFPSTTDLSDPGINCGFPALQADSLCSEPPGIIILYI